MHWSSFVLSDCFNVELSIFFFIFHLSIERIAFQTIVDIFNYFLLKRILNTKIKVDIRYRTCLKGDLKEYEIYIINKIYLK